MTFSCTAELSIKKVLNLGPSCKDDKQILKEMTPERDGYTHKTKTAPVSFDRPLASYDPHINLN